MTFYEFIIFTNFYSEKIESFEKKKAFTIAKDRDATITKSNKTLAEMTAFYGEIDNKINKLVLLVDFDKSYSAEEMNGFQCFLKLYVLDKLYKYDINNALREQPGEKSMFLTFTSVDGSDWNINPSKASYWNNRTEVPFLIFDLWFFLKGKPNNLTMRGLDQSYFEVVIDSQYAKKIKSIAINANDWTIYERHCNENNWEIKHVAWLPKNEKAFSVYFEEHNNMKYFGGKINFKEGAYKYFTSFLP